MDRTNPRADKGMQFKNIWNRGEPVLFSWRPPDRVLIENAWIFVKDVKNKKLVSQQPFYVQMNIKSTSLLLSGEVEILVVSKG